MSADAEQREQNARDLSQLMKIQDRLLEQLLQARDELASPATSEILQGLRSRTGAPTEETFGQIMGAIEEAIRTLKIFESQINRELFDDQDEISVEGVPNLPPHLTRFLAERSKFDGFEYDVRHDSVRGWIIHWKEYASDGSVRGSGQIYERPHAWLEE